MKLKYSLLTIAAVASLSAGAHTVVLSENFNGDYSVNFPVMIDADHLHPANQIQSIFMDAQGVMRPWRMAKDVATSPDGYIVSHSLYNPAGKSNDWLCSRAIEITDDAFTLSFDAKSLGFRAPAQKSSLWIFITETPVLTENDLPTEPTWVLEDLPLGEDAYNSVGYFSNYSFPLAQWAGKTIYLNFANLNENRDLLSIDNVIIQRLDPAELIVEALPLVVKGDYSLETSIRGTMENGLDNWKLTAEFSNGQKFETEGNRLSMGEVENINIPFSIKGDERLGYTITLTSDNAAPITFEGETRGLTFQPVHKVLMEEATGLWCGNCPMGQFTIESMMLDPEMNEKVIPVSVHVPSSSHPNYLVVEDYASPLGMTVAPVFRLDREFVAMSFSNTIDTKYNPENPESVAGTIRERASRLTTMDIALTGEFVVNGNDTTAIKASVKVTPALTQDTDKKYAIGLVLVENNVFLRNHPSWVQENYLSGVSELGEVGGWVKLPKAVKDVRLQDVARAVYGYRGLDGSLPATLKADEEYEYFYTMSIPDTYRESTNSSTGKTTVNAPAVVRANCGIVAYIIDSDTQTVVNSAYYPMTEQTEKRFTTADLLKELSGVGEIEDSESLPIQYYSIDGLNIANPEKGQLYIKRQGSKTSRIIF